MISPARIAALDYPDVAIAFVSRFVGYIAWYHRQRKVRHLFWRHPFYVISDFVKRSWRRAPLDIQRVNVPLWYRDSIFLHVQNIRRDWDDIIGRCAR